MREGRLPRRTGDVRQDAIRELRWAMGGAGLTIDKVPLMTAVQELPEVATAARGVESSQVPAAMLAVLVRALEGLGDALHARLLRNSLGIGYDGDAKDLTARRLEFVTAHNDAARRAGSRNVLAETPRAIYDLEQRMLGALVTALGATSIAVPDDDAGPPGAPWVSAEQDITFRLRGRCGYEAEVVHVVRAMVEGVDGLDVSYFCGTENEGGRARFRLLEGGTLEDDRTVGRPSFRTATIRYPRALLPGETWRLRYDTSYTPSPDPDPWFMLAVVRPTERATVRVTFDPGELPARVWRADGIVVGGGGGDPDAAEQLVPDGTGHVAATFDNPRPGLAYGVAWEWPG